MFAADGLCEQGPRVRPVLGASLEQLAYFPVMHDWLLHHFQRRRTFRVPMPTCTYTYTVDPANIEHILKTNFSNYPKGKTYHNIMEVLLGDGIFNSDGENWRKQRKTASHEFNRKTLSDFSAVVFRDYALKLAQILHQRHTSNPLLVSDMQELFMRLTLDSICKIGFGVELQSLTPSLPDNPFARAFDATNAGVTLRFIDPLWRLKRLLGIASEARLAKSVKLVNEFTYKVISTRRSELAALQLQSAAAHEADNHNRSHKGLHQSSCDDQPQEQAAARDQESVLQLQQLPSAAATAAAPRVDLLSRFITLTESDPEHLQDRQHCDQMLRDMVLNFVIAGRDTTAVTLSWFIYMMCMHPDVADEIYHELCQLQQSTSTNSASPHEDHQNFFEEEMTRFAQKLTFETVSKLTFLTAAITETVRLYPAVPQDPKGILADDVLPDGTVLKKGSLVTYVPYSMARMTWLWGDDAAQFRPRRWITPDGSIRKESDFKFTAFQAGYRLCLGKESAFLQMRITAALLCRFFRFHLQRPGHTVTYRMMAILAIDNGLPITVELRPPQQQQQ
ncbi:hypothetical protein BDL97_19G010300 [Sphagnum fallax]|nr:hypothetical protein BDL97_19G010300 [Sphagnum fallax]